MPLENNINKHIIFSKKPICNVKAVSLDVDNTKMT